MSSVYAVVWAYYESEGVLKYFLDAEAGLVHAASLDETAELLVNKTADVRARYGYLFE